MPPGVVRLVAACDAERVDRLICDQTGRGRRTVREWLRQGRVRVNGHVVAASQPVGAGSEILIEEPGTDPLSPGSDSEEKKKLRLVFESGEIVVVAKPAGVHSERGRSGDSLAALLEERYGDLSAGGDRPAEAGLVHRLDRDTSGVVVAARTRPVYRELRRAFSRGETTKQYLALASGRLEGPQEIRLPLVQRGARVAIAGAYDRGIEACTFVKPLESGRNWTLVLAEMKTGAMHQVRCHLAAVGHPLIGDVLYGGVRPEGLVREGQLLHALRIRIGAGIDVTTGPPEDFLAAYAALRRSER
jgi:23S rRNA pseudouridine1911/1915/1917 synthase